MKALLPSSFALAVVIGLAQLAACSALENASGPSTGTTFGQGGNGLTGSGGLNTLVGGGGGAGPEPLSYSAECGDGCLPGTGQAANCMAAGGGGGGGAGGATGTGGSAGDDCKLAVNTDGDAEGICSTSGTQPAGDICLSSADCLPGHGCVESVCRPYCCGALEACPDDTYCALKPMTEMGLDPNLAPEIPVCVPATHCELLSETSCPTGQTCTIVRADGTTSCVVPGDGGLDEACPCAAGYVCSTGTNTCKKLCKVDTPDCPAEAPKCQGGATTYPSGFGVCIST